MSLLHVAASRKEAERPPAAVLQEAVSARLALREALQTIVRLLDRLRETDSAEQKYWSLCGQHELPRPFAELPPDLRDALELRQAQKEELRAMFVACHEAERRWWAARSELNGLMCHSSR